MKFKPTLDKYYRPFIVELENFRAAVAASGKSRPCKIAVTGAGNAYAYSLEIFAEGHEDENYRVVERLAKALLWVIGGHRIYLYAPEALVTKMRAEYAAGMVPFPHSPMPSTSVRQFIEFAVYIPEQEPQVGQVFRSYSQSFSASIFPAL